MELILILLLLCFQKTITNLEEYNYLKTDGICGNIFYEETDESQTRAQFDFENTPEYLGNGTIYVAVSIDKKLLMDRFTGDMYKAKQFVIIHMAYLQKQLKQPNMIGLVNLQLNITKFSIFEESNSWEVYVFLRKFCDWSSAQTTADVHILFSGWNLWWKKDNIYGSNVLGLAYTRQLCSRKHSCIVLEANNGFRSLHTLVHEFGHNLGANHDGFENHGTQGCDQNSFIMSPAVKNGRIFWSNCSIVQIYNHLSKLPKNSKGSIDCLTKKNSIEPVLGIDTDFAKNPGLYYTPDDQCQLVFGPKYFYSHSDNICLELNCKNNMLIVTTAGALESTSCGRHLICERDICKRIIV